MMKNTSGDRYKMDEKIMMKIFDIFIHSEKKLNWTQ